MSDDSLNAAQTANALPARATQLTLHCPLCSATAPARGLVRRTISDGERWDLAFICPTCGLYTTFDTHHLKPDQITRMHGSPWAARLRQPERDTDEDNTPIVQTDPVAHFLTTFTACGVLWLLLTGSVASVDLLWGVVVCTSASLLTYRFTGFGAPRWMQKPRRWWVFAQLMAEFVKQILVQNITLSRRVFARQMPIKPGIVAVPYYIRGDVPLTILSSLVTLTPDTVVVDVDQQKNLMYIHWIDVQTTDPQQAHQLLLHDLENKVADWLKD